MCEARRGHRQSATDHKSREELKKFKLQTDILSVTPKYVCGSLNTEEESATADTHMEDKTDDSTNEQNNKVTTEVMTKGLVSQNKWTV